MARTSVLACAVKFKGGYIGDSYRGYYEGCWEFRLWLIQALLISNLGGSSRTDSPELSSMGATCRLTTAANSALSVASVFVGKVKA